MRETSRLISRLRHRQFGVLVTTSYVDAQAYREIREDGHPVVVLAGRDVIERLKAKGLDNIAVLRQYLHDGYLRTSKEPPLPDSNGDGNTSDQRQATASGDSAALLLDPRQLGICPASLADGLRQAN